MRLAEIGASQKKDMSKPGFFPSTTQKYRNVKTEIDGITFDSKREAERWCELKLLEKAGEIHSLKRQVSFLLIPDQKVNGKIVERAVRYYADFVYFTKDNLPVVEDVKSEATKTAVYKIKRKLMRWKFGIVIQEV